MADRAHIKTAHSFSSDARIAVREFYAALSGEALALVVFFCSSHYDLDAIADEMNLLFSGVKVIGCTTAGEIGSAGYRKHSLSGFSLPIDDCKAVIGRMDHLQAFKPEDGQSFVARLIGQLDSTMNDISASVTSAGNRCAIQLIDGLSHCEESVVHIFQRVLCDIPLVGGSAGDDLKFEHTWVFCDGAFHTDSVVLAIIDTVYPITVFKTQHFVGGQERLVVTEVDTASRTVMEINGLPAAQEYARVIGVRPEDLNADYFSESPVVVRINGVDYVRSIQKVNPDGSLTFYCAIDRGLILKIAHAGDFIENLQQTFDDIHTKVGTPQLVIACDCIFRSLEVEKKLLTSAVENIFKQNNVVGFNTYGEQFVGIHVNQTLTGLAIGYKQESQVE